MLSLLLIRASIHDVSLRGSSCRIKFFSGVPKNRKSGDLHKAIEISEDEAPHGRVPKIFSQATAQAYRDRKTLLGSEICLKGLTGHLRPSHRVPSSRCSLRTAIKRGNSPETAAD